MECEAHIGRWQWLACFQISSSRVIFPLFATVFPTTVSSVVSSVLCFIVWIASGCMSS